MRTLWTKHPARMRMAKMQNALRSRRIVWPVSSDSPMGSSSPQTIHPGILLRMQKSLTLQKHHCICLVLVCSLYSRAKDSKCIGDRPQTPLATLSDPEDVCSTFIPLLLRKFFGLATTHPSAQHSNDFLVGTFFLHESLSFDFSGCANCRRESERRASPPR